jgi:hypothetical protein
MRSVYISLYYKYSNFQPNGVLRGHTILGFYLIPAHCKLTVICNGKLKYSWGLAGTRAAVFAACPPPSWAISWCSQTLRNLSTIFCTIWTITDTIPDLSTLLIPLQNIQHHSVMFPKLSQSLLESYCVVLLRFFQH